MIMRVLSACWGEDLIALDILCSPGRRRHADKCLGIVASKKCQSGAVEHDAQFAEHVVYLGRRYTT